MTIHPEKVQLAAAVGMTVVEYGAAIFYLCVHGDWLSLFLAITYYVRETRGGVHYHAVVAAVARKLVPRRLRKSKES